MIGCDAETLPVLVDDRVYGDVAINAVLTAVCQFLDAATVEEPYSTELINVNPETVSEKRSSWCGNRTSLISRSPRAAGWWRC